MAYEPRVQFWHTTFFIIWPSLKRAVNDVALIKGQYT